MFTGLPSSNAASAGEAISLPCASCGAPLRVDPLREQAWCAMCAQWQSVPRAVQVRAADYARVLDRVAAARAEARAGAEAARRSARWTSLRGLLALAWASVLIVLGVFIWLPSIPFIVGGVAQSYAEIDEFTLVAAIGLTALVELLGLLGLGLLGFFTFRLYRRHRRSGSRNRAAAAAPGSLVDALCGVCGGQLAFQVGSQSASCGYCSSVVLPTPAIANRLVGYALDHRQYAELELAQAEREKLKVESALLRRRKVLAIGLHAGTGALISLGFALPLFSGFYYWRTRARNVETALIEIARDWHGEFGAGLEAPFDWLDSYWIGETPTALRGTRPLQSRWSVELVFQGRPLLISASTNWSDRVAQSFAVLVARPRSRAAALSKDNPVARRLRTLGFSVDCSYPGIVIERAHVPMQELSTQGMIEVVRAACELAEA